jgi:hypothetical protein
MKGKDIANLNQAAERMVQGSLSEVTRQCGDPSCACAHDPARRHGPHLYLKFTADGKAHSVYVPAEQSAAVREAQQAWIRFQEIGGQIAAHNRARLLSDLKRDKELAKAQRLGARKRKHAHD